MQVIVIHARRWLRSRQTDVRRWLDRPIYVELLVRVPIERLWQLTQSPDLHQRWDLRFTDIDYLPRPDETMPQRFLYSTRIGFGLSIRGEGESAGTHESQSSRTSALRFWSADPKSLIREGSGYWQYVQTPEGVRFLTRYGYDTRFGVAGRWFDGLVFRPLIGWATAWSFDRLRLWAERGAEPDDALRRSAIHAVSRGGLAGVWIYQGIVPKLLVRDSGELEILRGSSMVRGSEAMILTLAGIGEVAFGASLLRFWQRRSLFLANDLLLIVLVVGALGSRRRVFVEPFNPASLTLAMLALSTAGRMAAHNIPSSRACLRRAPSSRG